MTDNFRHFLLVFDHRAASLINSQEFEDVDEALIAYAEAEERNDAVHMEVVLIGADSLDTVKQTHGNYFDGTAALAKALSSLLDDWAESATV